MNRLNDIVESAATLVGLAIVVWITAWLFPTRLTHNELWFLILVVGSVVNIMRMGSNTHETKDRNND
jgi:hypothetical protein